MDFREGGVWLYSMTNDRNEVRWYKAQYKSIEPLHSYAYTESICDELGQILNFAPPIEWQNTFVAQGKKTSVAITIQFAHPEALGQMLEFGFKEEFAITLQNLARYIQSRFQLRYKNKTNHQPRVCTYLNFDGKTEEAFLFYKKVFRSEFVGKGIERFEDVPASTENWPPVAEDIKKMVLHVELPITGGHILMGTDAPKEMGFKLSGGNNMHICIEPESREEADRLFKELSEGEKVSMPMADMFFGAYFGEFTDKYSINWMINFQTK